MSVILGINGLPAWHMRHDPSAALVVDGKVMAVVEEERLARVKRATGHSPVSAAKEVLNIAHMNPEDIDVIAYPWDPHAVGAEEADVAEAIHQMLASGGINSHAEVIFVEHH